MEPVRRVLAAAGPLDEPGGRGHAEPPLERGTLARRSDGSLALALAGCGGPSAKRRSHQPVRGALTLAGCGGRSRALARRAGGRHARMLRWRHAGVRHPHAAAAVQAGTGTLTRTRNRNRNRTRTRTRTLTLTVALTLTLTSSGRRVVGPGCGREAAVPAGTHTATRSQATRSSGTRTTRSGRRSSRTRHRHTMCRPRRAR